MIYVFPILIYVFPTLNIHSEHVQHQGFPCLADRCAMHNRIMLGSVSALYLYELCSIFYEPVSCCHTQWTPKMRCFLYLLQIPLLPCLVGLFFAWPNHDLLQFSVSNIFCSRLLNGLSKLWHNVLHM